MKKVLFIAYLYPPIANSGTRRSLAFANHLPASGWEPIVLTLADPPAKYCEPSLSAEVRPGTRIERAPAFNDLAARNIANAFRGIANPEQIAAGLSWRIESLWRIPDECALWWPSAVRRGVALYRTEGFDVIYASGYPWTSFLVAREISRRTGRPYIIDYRDLWEFKGTPWESQGFLQRVLNPRLENLVLRGAAAVVTTTESFARELERHAPGKVICITNGFDPDDFVRTSTPFPRGRSSVFRVVYTGVWRRGYGPDDLYTAVRRLKEARPAACLPALRVIAAGFRPGPAATLGIDDVVTELGPIPHERALELMASAQALYLPVSTGFYAKASLPGKLFEYLASGRPILASVPPDSEVANVLNSVGGALSVPPGDVAQLASILEDLCAEPSFARFGVRRHDDISRYARSRLTRQLAAVLDSVVQERTRATRLDSTSSNVLRANLETPSNGRCNRC